MLKNIRRIARKQLKLVFSIEDLYEVAVTAKVTWVNLQGERGMPKSVTYSYEPLKLQTCFMDLYTFSKDYAPMA